MNTYGHFDDARREYVITRPDTPLPWLNYLGQDDFFGLCTNCGGGYTFYRDAKLRRLTRYRYNEMPYDNNGRYLYIKDGDSIWCPAWKPVRAPLDRYECRHGAGYTRITGEKDGVEVEMLNKVPGLKAGVRLQSTILDLSFCEAFKGERIADAYERLLLEAMRGNQALFIHRDEVEWSWKWIDSIQNAWASQDAPLRTYPAGTWGPVASVALMARDGREWAD